MAQGVSPASSSITITLSSLFSSHSQGFHPLVSQSGFVTSTWSLIHSNLHPSSSAKWYTKVSNLLSCSPTLSGSPEASRVADNCMSFSYLSFSSNSLTQAPASSWALMSNWTAHSRVQPIARPLHFPLLQCAMCSYSSEKWQLAFLGHPHTHGAVHKHLTYGPPFPTWRFFFFNIFIGV